MYSAKLKEKLFNPLNDRYTTIRSFSVSANDATTLRFGEKDSDSVKHPYTFPKWFSKAFFINSMADFQFLEIASPTDNIGHKFSA